MLSGGSYALGALAGILSTLSPCVLPLLPIIVGSAATAHRYGALALAGGLMLSFVVIGLFVATIGFSIGLDGDLFRNAAAVLMMVFGFALLSTWLQGRFASAGAGFGGVADRLLARMTPAGLRGQLVVGLLLGAVWSPCVGPTLGAAATLAAQREALGQVAVVMLFFGLGATLPLLVIGGISRAALLRWRGRIGAAGQAGKTVLGVFLIVTAGSILSGVDHFIESVLVEMSPAWLTEITTRF